MSRLPANTPFRVANRFVNKPMKPEKMQALLLKLRKGADSSIRMVELDQVLGHLGGWVLDETAVWQPQGGEYVRKDEPKRYRNVHPGNVQIAWETAKSNEVKHLPNPESVKLYHTAYMDVSDIKPSSSPGVTEFWSREFQAKPGIRITAPNHKVFDWTGSFEEWMKSYPQLNGLLKWLKTETPFLDQINAKLGTPSLEVEKAEKEKVKKQNIRSQGNIGTCPVCFGNYKLTPKTKKGKDKSMPGMVLHGYLRPGTGFIHGNCFGQDYPPFELSHEGTSDWVEALESNLGDRESYLKRLERNEFDSFYDKSMPPKLLKKEDMSPQEWDKIYKSRTEEAKGLIEHIKREISRLKQSISSWKPEPLP